MNTGNPEKIKYEEAPELNHAEIISKINSGSVPEIIRAVLAASMNDDDWEWAQNVCISQSKHENSDIRGVAILGLGHIARIHGKLEKESAIRVIRNGLLDPVDKVRGQADSAKEDVEHFMEWKIN